MDKNNLVKIINTALIVVCIFIVSILAMQKFDAYLKFKIVNECMKISRFEREIPAENAHIVYPVDDSVQKCLKANNL